jgi:hypothetical protein
MKWGTARGIGFQIFSMLSNSETVFNSDSENIGFQVGSEVVVGLEGGTLLLYLVNQSLSAEHSLSECSR